MPIEEASYLCSTPGETLAQFLAYAWSYQFQLYPGGFYAITGPTWTDYLGLASIDLEESLLPFYDERGHWYSGDTAAGTLTPSRSLLDTPGVSTAVTGPFAGSGAEVQYTFWSTQFLQYKKALIEAMTGEACSDPVITTLGPQTNFQSWTSVMTVHSGSSVLVTVDTLRQGPSQSGYNLFPPDTVAPDLVTSPATATWINGNNADLVEAVNAITDQDMEISFNGGKYTFSIKAKVLTGP